MDTNASFNILQDLVPDLVPDLTKKNNYALDTIQPLPGGAAPLNTFGVDPSIFEVGNLASGKNPNTVRLSPY